MLKIYHIIPSVGPKSFGLGPVALNLADQQHELGLDPEIWCLEGRSDLESLGLRLPQHCIHEFNSVGPSSIFYSPGMERASIVDVSVPSVVHQHGVWTALSRVTLQMVQQHKIPSVVTPHGSLDGWALKKSTLKKRIALALYERNNLLKASCFHAVGENEISHIRDLGYRNPIAVIPNGISQDWISSRGNAASFRLKFSLGEKRLLLFLSRITPKKGIPMLLEALSRLERDFGDWHLVIAGSDEFNHLEEVKRLVDSSALRTAVTFTGPLFGDDKLNAYAAADLFILPSYSEGAPVVILEALGASVPVIATTASPWNDLNSHNCGWLTDISVDGIASALQKALHLPLSELQTMGSRGKELVESCYSWRRAAEMTSQLYEWLHVKADKPDFVVMD